MSLKKFVVIPLIIAVLAFLIQIVDQLLSPCMNPLPNNGFCWIAFQAWAVYFLAGCTVTGGIKSLIGYAVGITGSIVIMNLAGVFSVLGFFSVPVAVALIACALIFLERTTWLNFIPSMFIGAGAFFAFMSYVPGATYVNAAITEIVYCLLGLIFGFTTIVLRTAYEKRVNKK
jgi:drug/metabolite transporter (DMT)-like permease